MTIEQKIDKGKLVIDTKYLDKFLKPDGKYLSGEKVKKTIEDDLAPLGKESTIYFENPGKHALFFKENVFPYVCIQALIKGYYIKTPHEVVVQRMQAIMGYETVHKVPDSELYFLERVA